MTATVFPDAAHDVDLVVPIVAADVVGVVNVVVVIVAVCCS